MMIEKKVTKTANKEEVLKKAKELNKNPEMNKAMQALASDETTITSKK